MSADLLRRAAKQMRERAEAAAEDYGYWEPEPPASEWTTSMQQYLGSAVGTHSGSWSPPVALAVANWLDVVADIAEDEDRVSRKWPEGSYAPQVPGLSPAETVARVYLGEAS